MLLVLSNGPQPVRNITEAASQAGGVDGRVEALPLDEALEKLGDYAYPLALDQWLTSERARRLLDWTFSAPSVLRNAREALAHNNGVLRITVENGLAF